MKSETKLWITVILSIIILLSPVIAELVLNRFNAFDLYSTYYLITRTDFSIGIKIVCLIAIVGVNRKT